MVWRGGSLICLALAAAQPALSAPAILNPDWLKKPNGENLSDAYPVIAQALSLSGRAVLRCLVTAQGTLRDCEVESEAPLGFGFGEAALSLSQDFTMRPLTVAGTSVDGGEVRIPMAFQYPADDTPTAMPAGPAPSVASMALAREVAKALDVTDTLRTGLADGLHDLEASGPAVDPAIRAAALNAYREAADTTVAAAAETMALTYAATFTDQQLRDILASTAPLDGSAPYATPRGLAIRLLAARADAFDTTFRLALHERFCQRWPCVAGPPARPPTGDHP